MNKTELADGPKGKQPRRALGKFTHVDAVQMAQLGRRSPVPDTTLERRGEEGKCQGQGASGEAARGAGRRRSYRRGCQCRCGAAGWTAGLRAPALPSLAVLRLAAAGVTL